jgi:hypothetical protein
MARTIITNQPSTGKSLRLSSDTIAENPSENWTTLVEAPDFRIPLRNEDEAYIIVDTNFEIVPGELFLNAPLLVTNFHDTTNFWVQFRILQEDGETILLTSKIDIPANDTALIPIQGQVLLKLNELTDPPSQSANGDRLQVQCEEDGSEWLSVFGSASESQAGTHSKPTE